MFIAIILLLLGLFGFIPWQASLVLAGGWLVFAGIGVGFLQRRVSREPTLTGTEIMIGAVVPAVTNISRDGQIRFDGETWNARSTGPVIEAASLVRVVRVQGLVLLVEPADG